MNDYTPQSKFATNYGKQPLAPAWPEWFRQEFGKQQEQDALREQIKRQAVTK